MKRVIQYVVIACMVALGAFLVSTVLHLISDAEEFQSADEASLAERAELRTDLEQNEAAVQALTEQLEDLGQEPVVTPPTSAAPTSSSPSVELLRSLVRFAVETSCGGPSCEGAVGPVGAPGLAGIPGKAGPPGADGTDGANGVDGAPGPVGPPGANGLDGRGVVSITCGADGVWTIAYTDGTTSTTPGPCRVVPEPPVEPDVPLEPAA